MTDSMERRKLGAADRKVLKVAVEEFPLRSAAIPPCSITAAAVAQHREDSSVLVYLGTDSGYLLLYSWKRSATAALQSPRIRPARSSPRNSQPSPPASPLRHSHSPSREGIDVESLKSNGSAASPERQRSDLRLVTLKSLGRAVEAVCVLEIVGQAAVLVDGQVLLVDFLSLESLGSIPGCKGVTAIAHAISFDETRVPPSPRLADGGDRAHLAVAVRSKILLFEVVSWRQEKENVASPGGLPVTKLSLMRELFGIEGAHALAWVKNSIFIGTSREYILFTLRDSRATRLFSFPVESPWKPLLKPFPKESLVLLVMDIAGIMVNEEGLPVGGSLVFSEIPDAVGQSSPYALVVNKGVVELYHSQTGSKVQSLAYGSVPVEPPCLITDDNDGIIVIANGDKVSCFTRISVDDQLKDLLKQKQYSEAVKLANEEEGAKSKLGMVHAEAGFLLLADLRFEEAIDHFLRSDIVEPTELFPFFPSLTSRWRNMVPRKRYWGLHAPPQPIRTVIESGLYSLQNGLLTSPIKSKQFQGGSRSGQLMTQYQLEAFQCFGRYWETTRKRDLSSTSRDAVDTVLVKLYIELGATKELEALVAASNHCLLEEVESLLRTSGQFRALAFLYESKNMLDCALETWHYLAQSAEQSATLETARLLERCFDTDLVLRHVLWVIRLDENMAFRILTSPQRTKALPADDVLRVLEADSTMIRQRYLQWLIDDQGFDDAHIHTELALSLSHSVLQADEGPDSRAALQSFLESSSKYDVGAVLDLIRGTNLWREQAILHRKQGNEKLALEILALKLQDSDAAENYCAELGRPDAYMQLLQTYLGNEGNNVKHAVRLLDRHGPQLDPIEVLDALPPDMPLHLASQALVRTLRARIHLHRQGQIEKHLTRGINFQTRMKKLEERSREIQVTGESVCSSCNARIGTKLFAVFPNESIACYKCLRLHEQNTQ
ncbi:transforming growth factor-beta receptor-associated protein 1 homolog [Selaginella moellendorffii]|uniref:transforming growth factor-beta receptor-associated protein 1 homolog n=1 Tax=Selaginella moellendorffii TaxID=88036 RepID=UPI000D1C2259|nr:transforming growth factor-beta receptor-associated protein 1 homolog [Selaginella moellendorffii]|eukprot:XP_024522989.1 transforming growth factor-beta receptor-associated protein 1 homolog [Selaginella moellendorffii]